MKGFGRVVVVATLLVGPAAVWAHEEHEHAAGAAEQAGEHAEAVQEQALTGEVVDVFCYLSHGTEGLGPKHAGCARKCIKQGLPVAIKVGDQLYLASMADHSPANNALADLAAKQVTVHGKVMERDGQRFIAASRVEPVQ